jgi:hypothetical protein
MHPSSAIGGLEPSLWKFLRLWENSSLRCKALPDNFIAQFRHQSNSFDPIMRNEQRAEKVLFERPNRIRITLRRTFFFAFVVQFRCFGKRRSHSSFYRWGK